jgi:capsular polysaccharide biosynthesis protein
VRWKIEDFLRRWRSGYEGDRVFRVLVITVVIAAYAVTSASLQQAPTYEASAQVWVAWDQRTLEYRGELPTQEIMYTIGTRSVAQEATQRLGLQMDPDELSDNLTVEQVESTNFIVLTYESTDPVKAAKIVNTVGEVSSEFISERSIAGIQLTAKVWEKAILPESPASPHPWRNELLTLAIGLVLCTGLNLALPGAAARVAGKLGKPATDLQGVGQAGILAVPRTDPRVERIKEQELLEALDRRGKLTAVEAALETSLSVDEANRMLFELAARGHLEVTVEDGKLLYSFWGEHGA